MRTAMIVFILLLSACDGSEIPRDSIAEAANENTNSGVPAAEGESNDNQAEAPMQPPQDDVAEGANQSSDPDGTPPSETGADAVNAGSAPEQDDGGDSAPDDNGQAPVDDAPPPQDVPAARTSIMPRSDRDTFDAFTDLVADNPVKRRYGIAVTDIDGDGDFEAVVTGYGGANEVLDWQGGQLVDVTPPSLRDEGRRAIGVAACDVTGDGREEVYFLNVDRFGGLGQVSDRLYKRAENGWQDLFELEANSGAINRFAGRSVACLDRNGDGQYGVFVANYGGPMKLFEADADLTLVDRGPEAGIDLTTGGRSLLVLPGQDGLDLFAGNERGANFFFRNRGDGGFSEEAVERGIADPFETVRGVALFDANRDGLFDLVYGNWEGPHRLFLQQDDGRFVDSAPPAMAIPSRIRTVIAADFDNDGKEDLFWNNIGQPNRFFRYQNGTWVAADIGDALEPDGLGTGAAVVDLDEDGVLELLIAHGESGAQPLSLYRWGRNENHFLRVFPKTRQGGPARGASVTLTLADGTTQRRVIDSGSGYLCQMEPVAHFGLGQATDVVRVDIRWPDGVTRVIEQPAVDQKIVVNHPQAR